MVRLLASVTISLILLFVAGQTGYLTVHAQDEFVQICPYYDDGQFICRHTCDTEVGRAQIDCESQGSSVEEVCCFDDLAGCCNACHSCTNGFNSCGWNGGQFPPGC
jgi:hypothetical protein